MTEANEIRGEMKCTIGDQEFVLVPTFRRIAKLESALGRPLIQLAGDIARTQNLSFTDAVTIVDVMAREPKLKTDEIGALIVRLGLQSVVPLITEFLDRVLTGGAPAEGNPEAGAPDASSGA